MLIGSGPHQGPISYACPCGWTHKEPSSWALASLAARAHMDSCQLDHRATFIDRRKDRRPGQPIIEIVSIGGQTPSIGEAL
jgi:hypothetical protein